MIEKDIIKHCILLCGMSDTDLKEQWEEKFDLHNDDFTSGLDCDHKEQNRIKANIRKSKKQIYFNTKLKQIKNIKQLENSIIILDESHYGATENSEIHQVFKRLGIQNILDCENPLLKMYHYQYCYSCRFYNSKMKIKISVNKNWGRVYMKPGDGYIGITNYYNNDKLLSSIKFTEKNEQTIIEILNKYRHEKKYMIIRVTGKKAEYIEQLLNKLEIPIQNYNQKDRDIFDTIEPREFTIVLIKGRLRAGKEFVKQYICAVYESSDNPKTDSLLQALPGRVCGYNIENLPDIYIPGNKKEIYELVKEFELINKSIAKVGLTNTKFVRKVKRPTIDSQHTPEVNPIENCDAEKQSFSFTIPQTIEFDEEDFDLIDMKDSTMKDAEIKKIIDMVDRTKYSEEQNKEIDELLTEPRKNTTIRNTHCDGRLLYQDCWQRFSDSKLLEKQFTLFDSEQIIIARIKEDIPKTCLKANTMEITFKLKSPNKHIEMPHPVAKRGEMHTPKNSSTLNDKDAHRTIQEFTEEECTKFKDKKNGKDNIIKAITKEFKEFDENEDCKTKELIMIHKNDSHYDNIEKPSIAKHITGITSPYKKNDLKKAIKKISDEYKFKSIDCQIPGKTDKKLGETGLYIYKQIKIIMNKD